MEDNRNFDRSDIRYAKIKDVVKCRNEFIHPKPTYVSLNLNEKNNIEFAVKKTKTSNFPLYLSLFEPLHAKYAINDILSFMGWIVFDICDYDLEKGSMLIGNGSVAKSGEVLIAGDKYGFDLRPFGTDKE